MLPVEIQDSGGSGVRVRVTPFGQLVTSPLEFSQSKSFKMSSINTAYNFIEPSGLSRVVITGLIIGGDKSVSTTDGAVVDIYETNSKTSTTIENSLFSINLIKNQIVPIVPINLLTNNGVWISGKTDDANVTVTMLYYLVD